MRFVITWDFRKKEAEEMQVRHLKSIHLLWHLMLQIWKHRIMWMTRRNWKLKNKYEMGRRGYTRRPEFRKETKNVRIGIKRKIRNRRDIQK